ncbi:effector-associated constant component EACC1 [Streptomyces sp. NBC_00690]|uniref:effector-associated constant component EACC1 n=1 Tax=Streptomyces sp. NBC_00690 TaxID=2975808 RepID=UPI002E2809ED|nr:hypothetical protein [Streptomyces sp. NBC_00690]
MRIRIDSTNNDGQGTGALTEEFARWLAQDRNVGPYVEIQRMRPRADDGGMSGGLVEWLNLVLTSGFSAAALVYAHRSFRASQPPRMRQSVRLVVEQGGSRIVVEVGSDEDAAAIARLLAAPAGASASPSCPEGGAAPEGGPGAGS